MKKLIFSGISLLILLEYSFAAPYSPKVMTNRKPDTLFKTYFVHPQAGNDQNPGTSKEYPFKTLQQIEKIKLNPGDQVILAANQQYSGSLNLLNQQGNRENPIMITSIDWNDKDDNAPAIINFKGTANGILIQDCSFIKISNIRLTGNGSGDFNETSDMRCGILVTDKDKQNMTDIELDHIFMKDVYYENSGFLRNKNEVHSANGTQKYGWGIRITNRQGDHLIQNVVISNCSITDVSHTGIKLTGNKKNIRHLRIIHNTLKNTGGPGIQMSEVQFVYVANNIVDHSGSNTDSRKWGRGSGLWTWGSSNVLIENNEFKNANGPGDSDGTHIDFNCDNIIVQYNLSYHNAGGFCEILGNNYNCTYRYNISVNDGYRVKGKNNAFQEGKILWLSGYVGNKMPRKGPVNTYIYNNTIYCDSTITPKIAIDNTSSGILIANNIFYVQNTFQWVLGDQYKPDQESQAIAKNVHFTNNLFLSKRAWQKEIPYQDQNPIFGDVAFVHPGDSIIASYIPGNDNLVREKGIRVSRFPEIKTGQAALSYSLHLDKDILGHAVKEKTSIGAIEP